MSFGSLSARAKPGLESRKTLVISGFSGGILGAGGAFPDMLCRIQPNLVLAWPFQP
jgi:hypothetical protein